MSDLDPLGDFEKRLEISFKLEKDKRRLLIYSDGHKLYMFLNKRRLQLLIHQFQAMCDDMKGNES